MIIIIHVKQEENRPESERPSPLVLLFLSDDDPQPAATRSSGGREWYLSFVFLGIKNRPN